MQFPNWPARTEQELQFIAEVLDSPQWGGFNERVGEFESRFAEYQGCRYGISVANGTVAIELALEACRIGPGDEVIVPAISFVATATSVNRVGAVPVFVDIESDTFNMDPDRAAAAVTPATKAIIVVHFGGPLARIDAFVKLARERGLVLIEDSAHAHGSEWNGQRAGSFGLTGSFSFQNGKVMTAGEGGMLTTSDSAFADDVRSIANQGRRGGHGSFHHFAAGTNYRLTAIQAAVLLAQLERLPSQIRLRTENAVRLKVALAEVRGLTFQKVAPEVTAHSHYLLLGRINGDFGISRDEFWRVLTNQGIPCTPFYPHPLYCNPVYQNGGAPCRVESCPVAEECVRDAFWLPHRILLADPDTILKVAEVIKNAATVRVRSR